MTLRLPGFWAARPVHRAPVTQGNAKKNLSGERSEEGEEKCNRCGKTHSGKYRHPKSVRNGCREKGHPEFVCGSKDKESNETSNSRNETSNCSKRNSVCDNGMYRIKVQVQATRLICMAKLHPGTQQEGRLRSKSSCFETGAREAIMIEGERLSAQTTRRQHWGFYVPHCD